MPRIALVAGEISGDRLGAALITAIRRRLPDAQFVGVAGPAMVAAGCEPWARSESLAVMGLAEVLRHLPRLRRTLNGLTVRLLDERPDLYVGIDAPDFNLRVASAIRPAGIRTVQYVCPSVWAWRQGRVRTLRRACDVVLCLLPFEPGFLHRYGIRAEFVGHPLADELTAVPDPAAARASARAALGLDPRRELVALLPGSRAGEVGRLGPVFAATAAWLARRREGVGFIAPMASAPLRAMFAAQVARHGEGADISLLDGASHPAMAAADAVLLASGTATLEAMLLQRPMVVAYRVSPATWTLLKTLRLVRVEHVALPNLLAGERLVPEFLQGAARPEALGEALLELLEHPALRDRLAARFAGLGAVLRRNASEQAAAVIVDLLGQR